MRNYDRINALPPKDIDKMHAYIIGGGLAGLSAAISLVTDAHMPPANITIYDSLPLMGGSMDGAGDSIKGYTCRGERELEARMECLWYICSKVPSIQTPGMTVLDETHYANLREPIYSKFRLMHKQGQLYDYSGPLMSVHDSKRMVELLLTPEEELEGLSAADWFSPDFTQSVFWYCWSTMLAFRPYHSLIEVRRYLARFMMYTSCVTHLSNILHTEYNEYDSIIKPMQVWLNSLGVNFKPNTTVTDIEIIENSGETVVTGLSLTDLNGASKIDLNRSDLVFFTSGSLTQNAAMGDTNSRAQLNKDTKDRGCFTLWEKLAAKNKKFGNPSAFLSEIEKTNFVSFFPTIKGDRTFFDFIEAKTGNAAGTGGAMTIVDSSWKLAFVLYNKYFPNQPQDVNVFFAYGQCSDVPGDFIKKPMKECTGTELFTELLYHCGCNEAQMQQILAHSKVSTAMMPYVTSQFMPRKISDRPKVIPDGCVNLAFLGQFVELPLDVVFTVETSVRTALMAVWGLTGLQKPMIPVYEPTYDIRVIVDTLKASLGIEEISLSTLPLILSSAPSLTLLWSRLNNLPKPLI
ncbi:oleate hydratase [Legionella fallonii]|uniref:67 kDa myosin-cross-reactive antigen family protein n=1 Tax=Legionella fallonii LLAP-10 TaxID=1212491 RepID=A0A098G163_9GAMM|nr:oleate hydratase [Legionella fallonii]CEG55726.1 67 kDa myosin-cross-reactive antigen family protein [Legionella fallonii LLAP-10]